MNKHSKLGKLGARKTTNEAGSLSTVTEPEQISATSSCVRRDREMETGSEQEDKRSAAHNDARAAVAEKEEEDSSGYSDDSEDVEDNAM